MRIPRTPPGYARLEVAALVALGEGTLGRVLCRDLLRHRRGLEAVEEPLEPADDLRLSDEQFGIGRRVTVEGNREIVQLAPQFRREHLPQLADRARVDIAQVLARSLVERRTTSLGEELADHRADPQE